VFFLAQDENVFVIELKNRLLEENLYERALWIWGLKESEIFSQLSFEIMVKIIYRKRLNRKDRQDIRKYKSEIEWITNPGGKDLLNFCYGCFRKQQYPGRRLDELKEYSKYDNQVY